MKTLNSLKSVYQSIFFFSLIFYTANLYGQDDTYPNPDIISKYAVSPTAASLGKFSEIPVSNYNGIPNISIPIAEVKTGLIQMPVTLNYHAGGIKVDERAGNVGLGWALASSGVINRTVLGLPDNNAGWSQLYQYYNGQMTQSQKVEYINGIANGTYDAQPDIYQVNVGSISFRFYNTGTNQWEVMPKNPRARVEYNTGGFTWIITDEKGIRYKFNDPESTFITTTNYSGDSGYDGGTSSAITSWYLTEIEDPNGNKVNYQYDVYNSSVYVRSSESVSVPDPTSSGLTRIDRVYTSSDTPTKFLKKIIYSNGTIEFTPSTQERQDATGDRSIASIKITEGAQIRYFNFYYSYFQANTTGVPLVWQNQDKYRLRLDSLKERDASGVFKPPYVFTYNYTYGLPYRNSYAQDHWGYYNGKNNTISVSYEEGGVKKGANKDPDPTYAIGGSLTQIKYPTGGGITLEYEGNKYYAEGGNALIDSTLTNLYGSNGTGSTDYNFQTAFSIQTVFIPNGSQLNVIPQITVEGVTPDCSCSVATYITGGPNNQTYNIINNQQIQLPAGNYVLHGNITNEFAGNPYVDFNISLKATVKSITGGRTVNGPGLRIKRIVKNFSGATEYLYFGYLDPATGRESGQLSGLPEYVSDLTISPSSGFQLNYQVYSSASNYPLANTQSYYIGYSTVTVTREANGEGGKTVYYYTNYKDHNDYNVVTGFPFPPSSSVDWMRGVLIRQEEYKKDGGSFILLKRYGYKYDVQAGSEGVGKGLKVGTVHSINYPTDPAEVYAGRATVSYDIGTNAFLLQRDTLVEDVTAGLNVISEYTYNSKYQLGLKKSSESDGSFKVTYISYPDDYPSGTTFIDNMKTNYLLSYPIEQVIWKESGTTKTILSGTVTRYQTGGKGLIDRIDRLETTAPLASASFKFSNRTTGTVPPSGTASAFSPDGHYKLALTYNSYDSKGNPTQVTPADGVPISYVWSYGSQYPVAEIRNATYSAVQTALGGSTTVSSFSSDSRSDADVRSFLAPLRSSTGLNGATATVYTYKPLVGMTSMTDAAGHTTYYQYDGFGRLQTVKDTEQKTTDTYDYHYRNQ